jgi:ADP-ribose pyrophosphatase YjhB (NUDIX family)
MTKIIAGAVIVQNQQILLVRERGRWELPKGGQEAGEAVHETVRRELLEETGFEVAVGDLAFCSEFYRGDKHYLQLFFVASIIGGQLANHDPDNEVEEARFIALDQLRAYMSFLPRLSPLEQWLATGTAGYSSFDLNRTSGFLPGFVPKE